MNHLSRIGVKSLALVTLAFISFSSATSSVLAYSTRYEQRAATYVDNYVERLQRGGYATADMTRMLIDLRSTYIKKQKSHLYTGGALQEIEAIIEELDSAIAGVSEGSCGTCNVYDNFDVYVPPRSSYYYGNSYYNNGYYYNYNYNNSSYYPYVSPVQNGTVRISNVTLTSNGSYYTEMRTDLVRENTNNASREYDVYTFVPQSNGYSANQPSSSRFLSVSLNRQLSSAQ